MGHEGEGGGAFDVAELEMQNTLRTLMSQASDDVLMAMALRFRLLKSH